MGRTECYAVNLCNNLLSLGTHLSCKLNSKLARVISTLICIGLTIMWILHPLVNFGYCGYTMIVGIGVVCFLCCRKKPELKDIDYVSMSLLIIIGIVFFISSLIFVEGNKLIFAVAYGFLLPIANIMLANKNNKVLFINSLSIASQISFVFLFVVSAVFAPIKDEQYSSITLNPNYLAVVLVPIIIGAIWTFEFGVTQRKYRAITLLLLSAEIVFMIMTRSRTGMLCVVVALIIWILKYVAERKIKDITKKFVLLLTICFVVMQIISFIFPIISYTSLKLEDKMFGQGVVFTTKQYVFVEIDSEISSIGNNSNVTDIVEGAVERAQKGSESGEDVSSGRFSIWKACLDNLNLKGHSSYDTFDVDERNLKTNDPHNIILSIGFQTGIVGAVVLFIFTIYCAGIFILITKKSLTKKVLSQEHFFCLLIYSAFFIVAMLSSTYTPLGSMLGYAFWCFLSTKEVNNGFIKKNNI